MIWRRDRHERERALAKLRTVADATISPASSGRWTGLPVTIRTLDPPLHEFLPQRPEEIAAARGAARA